MIIIRGKMRHRWVAQFLQKRWSLSSLPSLIIKPRGPRVIIAMWVPISGNDHFGILIFTFAEKKYSNHNDVTVTGELYRANTFSYTWTRRAEDQSVGATTHFFIIMLFFTQLSTNYSFCHFNIALGLVMIEITFRWKLYIYIIFYRF